MIEKERIEMHKFFESKLAFAAVVALFVISAGWSVAHGGVLLGVGTPMPEPIISGAISPVAEGPSMPPDPGDGGGWLA